MTVCRRLAAGALATVLIGVPLVATHCLTGCRKQSKVLLDTNLSPDTRLASAPAPGSQTNYRVHMYWDGVDPDGYVVAYYFAWDDTIASNWVYTTKTDSVFKAVIDTAGETRRHTFYIRAVDNEGKRDPSPARVRFDATTKVPVVDKLYRVDGPEDINGPNYDPGYKDTVLMGTPCTFKWSGWDEDGGDDGTGEVPLFSYRLDSSPFKAFSGDTTATVDSIMSDTHFFYVKAKDETGAESYPVNYRFVMNYEPDSEITLPAEETGTLIVPDKARIIFHWSVRDKEEIEGVQGSGVSGVKEVWIRLDNSALKRFTVDAPDYQDHFMFTSDTTLLSDQYMPSQNYPTGGNKYHEFTIFAKDSLDRFETPSEVPEDREIYRFWYNFPPTTEILEPGNGETVCQNFRVRWEGIDQDGEIDQYQYVLDPKETAWRTTTEDSLFYEGIAVGAHEFRVRAMDGSGCWETSYKTIQFYVEECK